MVSAQKWKYTISLGETLNQFSVELALCRMFALFCVRRQLHSKENSIYIRVRVGMSYILRLVLTLIRHCSLHLRSWVHRRGYPVGTSIAATKIKHLQDIRQFISEWALSEHNAIVYINFTSTGEIALISSDAKSQAQKTHATRRNWIFSGTRKLSPPKYKVQSTDRIVSRESN